MIESGKIAPKVYIQDHVTHDNDINFNELKESLRRKLIENGVNKNVKVIDKTLGEMVKSWWNGNPTATVEYKNFNGQESYDRGGRAVRGDSHSAVVFNGLFPADGITHYETWEYVNATLHELGHAIFSFGHPSKQTVQDYRTNKNFSDIMWNASVRLNPNASFTQIQRRVISASKWSN